MGRSCSKLMPMPTILVIDDNPAVATALELLFSLHDISTRAVTSPQDGLALLEREPIDLVVQDMNFHADTTSGEEGVALFARDPRAPSRPAGDPADRVDVSWNRRSTWSRPAPPTTSPSPGTTASCWRRSTTCWSCRRRDANWRATARASSAGAARWSATTTCAASCSPMPPANACSRSPARSRARNCRCWSPGPTAPARRRSPRSCMRIRRCRTGRSSRSTAARCRAN